MSVLAIVLAISGVFVGSSFGDCGPGRQLSNNNRNVSYSGYLSLGDECSWVFPEFKDFKHHALVLHVTYVVLTDGEDNCIGWIYFPKKWGVCKVQRSTCYVYIDRTSECTIRDVTDNISKHEPCKYLELIAITSFKTEMVRLVPDDDGQKNFRLSYRYFKCSRGATTIALDTTTQSKPTTPWSAEKVTDNTSASTASMVFNQGLGSLKSDISTYIAIGLAVLLLVALCWIIVLQRNYRRVMDQRQEHSTTVVQGGRIKTELDFGTNEASNVYKNAVYDCADDIPATSCMHARVYATLASDRGLDVNSSGETSNNQIDANHVTMPGDVYAVVNKSNRK